MGPTRTPTLTPTLTLTLTLPRYNYSTPKSFLELIALYRAMLTARRAETDQRIETYVNGVEKLRATASQVSGLALTRTRTLTLTLTLARTLALTLPRTRTLTLTLTPTPTLMKPNP